VLAAVHVSRKYVFLKVIQKILLLENTALKLVYVSSDSCWVHEFGQCKSGMSNLFGHKGHTENSEY
jgi:hypothetical protein